MSTTQWDFDLSHSQRQLPRPPPHGVQGPWPVREMGRHARARRAGSDAVAARGHDRCGLDRHEGRRSATSTCARPTSSRSRSSRRSRSRARRSSGRRRRYKVTGDLTIHGVTKSVTLEVEGGDRVKDPWGGTRTGFSAKTSISRKDFGLTWNVALEAGGFLVGDKIEITLEIEAVKKAATAARDREPSGLNRPALGAEQGTNRTSPRFSSTKCRASLRVMRTSRWLDASPCGNTMRPPIVSWSSNDGGGLGAPAATAIALIRRVGRPTERAVAMMDVDVRESEPREPLRGGCRELLDALDGTLPQQLLLTLPYSSCDRYHC